MSAQDILLLCRDEPESGRPAPAQSQIQLLAQLLASQIRQTVDPIQIRHAVAIPCPSTAPSAAPFLTTSPFLPRPTPTIPIPSPSPGPITGHLPIPGAIPDPSYAQAIVQSPPDHMPADNTPFYDIATPPNSYMGQTYSSPGDISSSPVDEYLGFRPQRRKNLFRRHDDVHRIPASLGLSPVTSNDSQFSYDSFPDLTVSKATTVDDRPKPLDHAVTSYKGDQHFSPLLSLPMEILYQIIEIVYYDDNTNSINSNLEKFSKTIPLLLKTLNQLSLRFLYKYTIFNRPHSFDKFLANLVAQPDIGNYVEFMDWQTFTSIGLGRTGRMNQEIQMVTSHTIAHALSMTPTLIEFLASENIQDDMDVTVLDYLFNKLPRIQALDFCGASSENFASAFNELVINDDPIHIEAYDGSIITKKNLQYLFKISFHDCSNLAPLVFQKILPHLINLRRLDLNHTAITSALLNEAVPLSCRLTHLSLARCSKLTTKDLINFLVNHPAVTHNTLQWLNLQIDSNVVSPLTDVYLLYTLKHLKAPDLRYLNIGGLPIDNRILHIIKVQFPNLESLVISHSSVDTEDLNAYLSNNTCLKFLDVTGCKKLTRWKITNLLKTNFHSGLLAIESDYKLLYELSAGETIKTEPFTQSFLDPVIAPHFWKFYDNEGRRAWLYKIDESDPLHDSLVTGNSKKAAAVQQSNLTYYDLETGQKIETKVKKPSFLKYASRKINCSIGYYNLNLTKKKKYLKNEISESVWPTEFSQRGIYNYYSLNIK